MTTTAASTDVTLAAAFDVLLDDGDAVMPGNGDVMIMLLAVLLLSVKDEATESEGDGDGEMVCVVVVDTVAAAVVGFILVIKYG